MSDQKGFNNIVPERDERIGQRRSAPAAGKPARAKATAGTARSDGSTTGGVWKAMVVILILAIGAMGWFGWQQYQQLAQLQASFDQLNERLAFTDDSVSKSGSALQLKINEQRDELGKHWAEIKKLWGIAYDTNKKQIAGNKQSAVSNTKRIGSLEKTAAGIATISKKLDQDHKKLADISGDTLAFSVEMEEVQQRLQDANDKLNTVEQSINRWRGEFGGRMLKNEEAVEAIDAFRRQVNQELLQLRKQLSSASASAATQSAAVPHSAAAVTNP